MKNIKNLFKMMDAKREDYLSVAITLLLLILWFSTLVLFNIPLFSFLLLWIGMIIISFVYTYIYKKKGRDMKTLKIRFVVSAFPIYLIFIYYIYQLTSAQTIPQSLRLLPFFVVLSMLTLNALVVYIIQSKKVEKQVVSKHPTGE